MEKRVGMETRANGKINLYLDVLSDGASGFHEIQSIMQSVSLCDRVTVSAVRGQDTCIRLSCNLPYIPCDARNIAYKASCSCRRAGSPPRCISVCKSASP